MENPNETLMYGLKQLTVNDLNINKLITYRKKLHQIAEIGGSEFLTSEFIVNKLSSTAPSEIITKIGGTGIAAIYGNQSEKNIMLRCELDALPINEDNNFIHKSLNNQVSHKCGHDGHMAIMLGVANELKNIDLKDYRIILLFQPDEENGNGALAVLNDNKFTSLEPDYIYALHNLPGYRNNEILCKPEIFAYSSRGLKINLKGKTSHAGEPQNAINPKKAMIQISKIIDDLTKLNTGFIGETFGTTIYMQLGSEAFGTTPGYAEVMGTLRAENVTDLDMACLLLEEKIGKISKRYKLEYSMSWNDFFSSTVNDKKCFDIIKKSAEENNYTFSKIEAPFRWTEDFGYFTKKFKGALFGLGTGENHLPLHNPKYDFPDSVIETGIKMFISIIKNTMENYNVKNKTYRKQ